MKKAGSNTKWQGLATTQLAQLEAWLFEEHVNYPDVLTRARNEFGFAGSVSSLKRFYQRRKKERLFADFAEVSKEADMLDNAPGDAEEMQSAALKMLSRMLLKRVMEAPDDIKEWEPLGKILFTAQDVAARNEVKREENRIRWERLEFSPMKYQSKVQDLAMDALPELNALKKAQDEEDDPYAYNKWANAVRTQLFGTGNFPDVLPESPEEEQRMEEEKEARRKAAEEGKAPRTIFPNRPKPSSESAEQKEEQPQNPAEPKKNDEV